jgi:hypothetical protein
MPISTSVNERERKPSQDSRGRNDDVLLKIKKRRRNRRVKKTTSCGYKEA